MRSPSDRLLLLLAAIALTATACGLPEGGSPQQIDRQQIPTALQQSDAAHGDAPTVAAPEQDRTGAFWVDGDGKLVAAVIADTKSPDAWERVQHLLDALASGPTDELHTLGLGTALGEGAHLTVTGQHDRHIRVEVDLGEPSPSADLLPLAIGQIVLTASTVPGVEDVELTQDGQPLPVPLPGGALTDGPLSAAQYGSLVDGK
jgi:hypothetical protein